MQRRSFNTVLTLIGLWIASISFYGCSEDRYLLMDRGKDKKFLADFIEPFL